MLLILGLPGESYEEAQERPPTEYPVAVSRWAEDHIRSARQGQQQHLSLTELPERVRASGITSQREYHRAVTSSRGTAYRSNVTDLARRNHLDVHGDNALPVKAASRAGNSSPHTESGGSGNGFGGQKPPPPSSSDGSGKKSDTSRMHGDVQGLGITYLDNEGRWHSAGRRSQQAVVHGTLNSAHHAHGGGLRGCRASFF